MEVVNGTLERAVCTVSDGAAEVCIPVKQKDGWCVTSTCQSCLSTNTRSPVLFDCMGPHTVCPNCESSYNVDGTGFEVYLQLKAGIHNTELRYKGPIDEVLLDDQYPTGYTCHVVAVKEGIIQVDERNPGYVGMRFAWAYGDVVWPEYEHVE